MWIGWATLVGVAITLSLLLLIVFVNHLGSPEITRGTILETVRRLLHGLPLYPSPSANFVPLAYNPLFPVLAAAFASVLGATPATLRLTAIVGSAGCWLIIFLAVRHETRSTGFGLLAAGLFAGAYAAFDCYLDYAQSDSWMLFCALLGLYVLQITRARKWNVLAIVLLCAAFWFKQVGALFAIAGVSYVTWRDGPFRAAPYWMVAGICGPLAYFLLGPRVFGKEFLYYTYEVPAAWTTFNLREFGRPAEYFLLHWPVLASVSVIGAVRALRIRRELNVWTLSFPFVILTAILGSLDYSENNVYMPLDVWFIVLALTLLAGWTRSGERGDRGSPTRTMRNALAIGAVATSFAVNFYAPRSVLVPRGAWRAYHALVEQVGQLEGLVYMPSVGQLPTLRLPIPVHWVPLEDLVRGPGRNEANSPLVRAILRPLLNPHGKAYIFTDRPLESQPVLAFLKSDYVLIADMGKRYESLRAMPGRYSGNTWPRYLYAYRRANSSEVSGAQNGQSPVWHSM